MLSSALPADVTNLLGDHSCHLVTVPPFGVAILFHAFVLISDSFSYPINPLAIPYVKVDYVVILRINFVLASNNSCIFRQNSFGRSRAATVYFVDQCLALYYFFIKYEKKSRPFATEKKPTSSVVFIVAGSLTLVSSPQCTCMIFIYLQSLNPWFFMFPLTRPTRA